ncbi:hypothetical protein MGALJ_39590 [Mycobacterium gallinarum]|uniref:Uncharacterized protein n=1 Tax=Mycobacterium gallinarum TaxID=39689 RepID=A0A9W4B5I7_9MYCO|nr:hypothetical protein MGALJ_39590 [Mycobacterium gallinarum]
MAHPKKGEEGYAEYLEKSNERRRIRRADPEYLAKEKRRWARQTAKREAAKKAAKGK